MIKKINLLLAAIVPASFFLLLAQQQQAIPWSYQNSEFYNRQIWFAKTIHQSGFPLWNPQSRMGVYQLADVTTNAFTPLSLPWFLQLPPIQALGALLIFLIVLASVSTYILAKFWTRHQGLSLVAAFAYVSGGVFLRSFESVPVLIGFALLPLSLWLSSKYASGRSPLLRSLLGLVLGVMMLQDQWILAGGVILSGLLYSVVQLTRHESRTLTLPVGFLFAGITSFCLAAPKWLPLNIESQSQTFSAAAEVVKFPWNGVHVAALIFFAALGGLVVSMKRRSHWPVFAGVAASFALVTVFKLSNSEDVWQRTLGLVNLQNYWPLLGMIYLFTLLLGLLGMRRLLAWQKGNMGICAVTAAAVFGNLLLAVFSWYLSKKPSELFDGLVSAEFTARSLTHVFIALGFAIIAVLIMALPERRVFRQIAWLGLALMILAEGTALRPKFRWQKVSEISKPSPLDAYIQSSGTGRLMYYGFDEKHPLPESASSSMLQRSGWSIFNAPHPFEDLRLRILTSTEILESLKPWSQVANLHFLLTPVGYQFPDVPTLLTSKLIIKQKLPVDAGYELYQVEVGNAGFTNVRSLKLVANENEAMAQVRQRGEDRSPGIIEKPEIYFRGGKMTADNGLWSNWLPQLGTSDSMLAQTPVSVGNEQRVPNVLTATLNSAAAAIGVWSEAVHPAWRIYVNKKEVPLLRVDFINRGIFVEKGTQNLEMRFEPQSWTISLYVAIFGGLLFLWGPLAWFFRRRQYE